MSDNILPAETSWVTPELACGRTLGLSELQVRGGAIYWLESRPAEGRSVLVRAVPDRTIADVTGPDLMVGTRVHEYGGGAYGLGGGDRTIVFCSDRQTGHVWRIGPDERHVVAGADGLRFADFTVTPDGAAAIAVREDHRRAGISEADGAPREPVNSLVWIDGATPDGIVLASGADFYAGPRLSPDGRRLAWIAWNHPAMPWDATRLMVADLRRDEAGRMSLDKTRVLAGEGTAESVMEPVWTPDGALIATTDRDGAWNPREMMTSDGRPTGDVSATRAWPATDGEVGLPHWVFGQTTMTPLSLGAEPALLCLVIEAGVARPRLLTKAGVEPIGLGTPQAAPRITRSSADLADTEFAWIDAPEDRPPAIVTGRPGEAPVVLRAATILPDGLPGGAVSRPENLTFPSAGGVAHALYYPAATSGSAMQDAEAPGAAPGGAPPMVVMAHGGPTGRSSPAFSFKVQWWTSRGFAVLDVNYRGSTGFGSAYRHALDGRWADLDVEDVLAGVRHAIETGRADPRACVIRGSSAGGLTVLAALARSDLFAAGTSLYGVTDLRALAAETHKFEARYLDGLIGPWPAAEALYLARSPIAQAEAIMAPVLFLHGAEDRVVPPAQAADMARRLRARGVRVEHHVYDGEGHGFRQEATMRDAFTRELAFYRSVLGAA